MTRPRNDTHARIRRAAEQMADVAALWESYIAAMNDYSPGVKSALGAGGRRGSGISDPTGQTVAALEDRPDPLLAKHHRLMCDMAIVLAMIDETRSQMRMTAHPTTTARDVRYCANLSCNAIIETPGSELSMSDRCAPCKRYKAEHDRDAPVRVIADRERKRAAAS